MFPMITSLRELQDAKAVLDECRAELRAEGKKFDEKLEVGTMIETPAAVFIARRAGRGVRLLLHRYERSDPVHLRSWTARTQSWSPSSTRTTPLCSGPSR